MAAGSFRLCGHPTWIRESLIRDLFTDLSVSVIEDGRRATIRFHRAVLFSLGGIFKKLLAGPSAINDNDDNEVDVFICDATLKNVKKLADFAYTGVVGFDARSDVDDFSSFLSTLEVDAGKTLRVFELRLGTKGQLELRRDQQQREPVEPSQPELNDQLLQHPSEPHHHDQQQQHGPQPQHQQLQQQEQEQAHQNESPASWSCGSKETFPLIMTDLLGDVSETLPDLALDSIEGEIIPNEDSNKNFSWSWRDWPTTTTTTTTTPLTNSDASSNDFSTVDNSEILYDFSCFDKTFNDSATSSSSSSSPAANSDSLHLSTFSTSSPSSPAANSDSLHLSTFSTSSPSNFSSTPPSVHSSDSNDDVDVDMASLVSTFCATPDVTVSSPTSSFSTEPTNRHLNLAPKHRVKGSTKSFSCSFCGKTFLSRHYFRFHVTSVHQKQKNATCSQCSKSFSGDYYLKQHIRRMHSDDRPHVCGTCNISFSVRYDLVVHLRTHESVKAFKCEACQRTYSNQRALKEHERTHTGERPYQCQVCFKRFALPKTLRVHFRQHSGERPYLCPKCGCTFVQNSTLRNHLKTNHGIESAKAKTGTNS